ncbi:MAG: hypothetical protein R2860_09910 [Desulfobacterales bacterium]
MGQVDLAGDFIEPEATLMQTISVSEQAYFNRDAIRQDVLALTGCLCGQRRVPPCGRVSGSPY